MPQTITSFQSKDEPVSIGILFDISGSMDAKNHSNESKLQLFLDGLKKFVDSGNDANEYFLAVFNEKMNFVVDKTQSRDVVIKGLEALRELKTEGNTNFYDAVNVGLKKLSTAKHMRRVLLIVSDGTDNSSKTSFDDIKKTLRTTEVLLYSVSPKVHGFSSIYGDGGSAFLDEIIFSSGGRAFYEDKPEKITAVFERISSEIQNQYTIGFVPSSQKTGKWTKLKVAIKLPKNSGDQSGKISVRYRYGFVY